MADLPPTPAWVAPPDSQGGSPTGFALGLVLSGWIGIAIFGPFALFLTWWGDCFSETCPAPTTLDGLVYSFDLVAWIAIGLLGLLASIRPSRAAFVVIAVLGAVFAAQGVAAFLGARGMYAFPILLPAAITLVGGGVAGARGSMTDPPGWAVGPPEKSFALGCGIYPIAFVVLFGVIAIGSDRITIGAALFALVALAVTILFVLQRRVR